MINKIEIIWANRYLGFTMGFLFASFITFIIASLVGIFLNGIILLSGGEENGFYF